MQNSNFMAAHIVNIACITKKRLRNQKKVNFFYSFSLPYSGGAGAQMTKLGERFSQTNFESHQHEVIRVHIVSSIVD